MLHINRLFCHLAVVLPMLVFTSVLAGCTSPPSTPTPTPLLPPALALPVTPTMPTVTIIANPPVTTVLAGETVAITANVSGSQDLMSFKWSTIKGSLSRDEGLSVKYIAPNENTLDTVFVEITGPGGTKIEKKDFKIVIPASAAPPSSTQISAEPPTIALLTRLIADFSSGIEGWQFAQWAANEMAQSLTLEKEALEGQFDFGAKDQPYPRATYYYSPPLVPEDWTSAVELRFKAMFIPKGEGNVKVTFVIKTDACYNEYGEFQNVQKGWSQLTFPLKQNVYKTCNAETGYSSSLVEMDKVIALHIVFVPSPDDARFSGRVLIDDVELVQTTP